MRLIFSLVTLAACAAATPALAQAATPAILPDGTLLDITATGQVSRTPDIATIRAGVVTQAPTAAAALSENAARMTRVIQALKAAGIAERDIMTSDVPLRTRTTLYTRLGDWVAYLGLVVTAGALTARGFRSVRR